MPEAETFSRVELAKRVFRRSVAAYLYYGGQLKDLQRRAVEQGGTHWRILRYKHIAEPEFAAIPMKKSEFVRPQTFRKHLEYLIKNCRLIKLADLVVAVQEKQPIDPNSVALTFDCGYQDFYTNAYPLLKAYRVPATVFLPTAFIGTDNLFWPDKILVGMIALMEAKIKFPGFPSLPSEIQKLLAPLFRGGAISLEAIFMLIDCLGLLPAEERRPVFETIDSQLELIGGMPAVQMFVDWDQVREMAESGIRFAPLGHSHMPFPEITKENLAADLYTAFETIRSEQIRPLNIVAAPYDRLTPQVLKDTYEFGLRYSMAVGSLPIPTFQEGHTAVFGRVDMYQDAAFCTELLACHIWNLNVLGYQY